MSPASRIASTRFEQIYAKSPDPWGYLSSEYERQKYEHTLAALPGRRIASALEVGCSIGVFTSLLAPRCEHLLGMDFSANALERARRRLAHRRNVEVIDAAFPEEVPPGPWDLIVCSEILYYLDRDSLTQAFGWLSRQLRDGACVLAVSWRGPGREEPFRGDEVHDRLARQFEGRHVLDGRQPGYRLDRFDGDAS